MLQMMFFIMIVGIGFLNYCLAKSYWCHEGVWGKDVHDQ